MLDGRESSVRLSGHGCGDIGASLERLVCWCECCRGLDMWYNVRQGGWEVAEAVLSQNSDHSEAGKLGRGSQLGSGVQGLESGVPNAALTSFLK